MRRALGSALVLLFVVVGCGSDSEGPTSATVASDTTAAPPTTTSPPPTTSVAPATGGASVSVVLSDPFGPAGTPGQFAVEPDPLSVDAGSLEFVAKNQGGDLHELVIVKGDDPALLPVDEYGAVIEGDLPEGDFIGEIALVGPGTEESASFDLDAGSYILFCNIVTLVNPPSSHFEAGMVNTLTVT
jgi:uncharacterized cupredoxin-like copper-binding protein